MDSTGPASAGRHDWRCCVIDLPPFIVPLPMLELCLSMVRAPQELGFDIRGNCEAVSDCIPFSGLRFRGEWKRVHFYQRLVSPAAMWLIVHRGGYYTLRPKTLAKVEYRASKCTFRVPEHVPPVCIYQPLTIPFGNTLVARLLKSSEDSAVFSNHEQNSLLCCSQYSIIFQS